MCPSSTWTGPTDAQRPTQEDALNETTTSLHIGDRVRIADTKPAWDGWTGTVSPSSAELRAGATVAAIRARIQAQYRD